MCTPEPNKSQRTYSSYVNDILDWLSHYITPSRIENTPETSLIPSNKYNQLIRAVLHVSDSSSDSVSTLSDLLGMFEMKWLLLVMDMSLNDMKCGKKTHEEYDAVCKNKINGFQRISLQYHPDFFVHLGISDTTEMQKKINDAVKALRILHAYVLQNPLQARSISYTYRLYGELPVHLLLNSPDLSKVINLSVCRKVQNIVYWEDGKLMEARNYYLASVHNYLPDMMRKLEEITTTGDLIGYLDSCRSIFEDIHSMLEAIAAEYVSSYEIWLNDLKKLNEDCKVIKELQVIRKEVGQLLEETQEQYNILNKQLHAKFKSRFFICDEVFAKPVLEYIFFFQIYMKFVNKLSEKVPKYLASKMPVFPSEITLFMAKMEWYIEHCPYEELLRFTAILVKYFHDPNSYNTNILRIYIETAIRLKKSYFGLEFHTVPYCYKFEKCEIRAIIPIAIHKLSELIKDRFPIKDTYFDKEKLRTEKARQELKKMSDAITEMEIQNEDLKERIKTKDRAKKETERKIELTQILGQEFTIRVSAFDDELYYPIVKSQSVIMDTIVSHSMKVNCDPKRILDTVINLIIEQRAQVISENIVPISLIHRGVRETENSYDV